MSNSTNKTAAKKAATKSANPAKKAAKTPAPEIKMVSEKPESAQKESVVSMPLKGIRALANRTALDSKFQVFRGKHIFCGEDHIGWLIPGTNKAVLRTEFEGFADWVKTKAQQVEGRGIGLIQLSDERPIFNVEDSAGKVCPQSIINAADPALGDLDDAVVEWHRENLSHEDFLHKYDGRLDIKRLGPKKAPGVAKVVTAEDLAGMNVAAAQSQPKAGKDGFFASDPVIDDLAGAVDPSELDDGRGEHIDDDDLDGEDVDKAGGGEDADGFLDEDPE